MSKSILFPIYVFTMLISSCQSESNTTKVSSLNESKLEALQQINVSDIKTTEQHTEFLTTLIHEDQAVREESTSIQKKFGHSSPELKAHYNHFMAIDKILQEKAIAYLDMYGFPDPAKYGTKGTEAILYVFHHSASDNAIRHRYLPLFYKAYQAGKIDESLFDFYLGRMYDNEFGTRMKMESPFKSADRIAKYLEAFKFSTN